jgi:hypothetical protein
VQSVPITTNVVSSNTSHGEVYSIQHYVIKFVSDLRQVGCFLWVRWFPPSIIKNLPFKLQSEKDELEGENLKMKQGIDMYKVRCLHGLF